MPLVSVVVPTYNRLPILKETIESVLAQDFSDLELIVVDDGSTDNTREFIEAIKDTRVHYFYKENGGVASARNFGFSKSSGKYIFNLDSDDYWTLGFLEIMVPIMEANPEYGAFYAKRTLLFPDGTTKESFETEHPKSGWITRELFLEKSKCPVHTSGTGFRKKELEGVPYDENLWNSADFDYWLRLSTKIRFLYVPDAAFIYRTDHNVNPRTSFSRENGNRIRILERFFFKLEGKQIIPKKQAFKKISHAYYSVGKTHFKRKHRAIAIFMFKHMIRYYPFDLRSYIYTAKALLLKKNEDNMRDWTMPPALLEI